MCKTASVAMLHHMVCSNVWCWPMPCHRSILKHLRAFPDLIAVHTSTALWDYHGDLGHLGSGDHPSLHSGWHHGQEQQVHLLTAKMCHFDGTCSPFPVIGLLQSHTVCMPALKIMGFLAMLSCSGTCKSMTILVHSYPHVSSSCHPSQPARHARMGSRTLTCRCCPSYISQSQSISQMLQSVCKQIGIIPHVGV